MASNIEALVIGGSAGALEALGAILPELAPDLAVPVAIVLHVHPDKPSLVPELLGARSGREVREAEDKQPMMPGTIYVAPPNYHLLIERDRSLSLSADDPVLFSRPSIDVLFESAADAYGPALAALLLSGASEDGARGLARIRAGGGTTIVQSPETSAVPTMPESALRRNAVDHTLALGEIGPWLARRLAGEGAP